MNKFKEFISGFPVCLMLLFFSISLYADITVSGTIEDMDGFGLPGVTVVEVGTNNGTISDIDGKYTLTVADDASIQFSFIGFATQVIKVDGNTQIDVILSQDSEVLEEVVVTGYTVDTRRNTPGSVSTIKAEDLKAVPSGNVEQQLQGRVSGVTVISNGQPGSTSQVRVRGYGALGGNQPLYVVDGVPVGSIDFLAPDDIESTTVLKDATSASIYGARAAGGVIVYTTKRGKNTDDGIRVFYDGVFGVTNPGTGLSTLDPQQHAEWTWNAERNRARQLGVEPEFDHEQYGKGNTPVIPDYLLVGTQSGVVGNINLADHEDLYNVNPDNGPVYQVIKANKEGTDWYDALTRNALLNRHNLGFSGGNERSRYYLGLGFQDQEGIIIHQKFSRYNLRLNTEFDITPWLRFGENMQITNRKTTMLVGDGGGAGSSDDENIINMAYRMPSIIPIYDEFGGYAGTIAPGFNNPENVIATADGNQNDVGNSLNAFGNIYFEVEPIQNLRFRSSFGGSYGNFNFRDYNRATYENSENQAAFGYTQGAGTFSSWVLTNTLNYRFKLDQHDFDILLGQEALNQGTFRDINGSGINPFSTSLDFVSLSTVGNRVVNGGHSNGVTFASLFGSLKYTLNDKYIFSAVLRRDGSSRFGAANRYGVFPAFSAAWRLSSEEFLSDASFIEDLKLRVGYGIMGNSNNVDPNNQYSLFGTSIGLSSYDIGGTNSSAAEGFYRTRIGNPNARWEKAITKNLGLDILLFNGRLDIGLEIWQKDTEDLLFQIPVTVQSGGYADEPSVNVGKMLNRGFDFTIIGKGKLRNVGYEVTLNGGFLHNEIVELADGITDLPNRSTAYRGIIPVLNQVGEPLSAFYGYNVIGLFSNEAEVQSAATQEGAAPGRFRFQDVNGDGTISAADRVTIGNPIPDFTGGLTIKLDYKNFNLEVYSFASIGNDIYNVSKLFTDFYALFPGGAIGSRVLNSWTFENPNSDIPIFENVSNFSTNTQSTSYYVEDGSYFRMQNITLGYEFGNAQLERIGMNRLRVFTGLNNIFTITKYSGLDPSVGGLADTNFGIDVGNVPITRSWTIGVNVGL